jgi:hypothetical protein
MKMLNGNIQPQISENENENDNEYYWKEMD